MTKISRMPTRQFMADNLAQGAKTQFNPQRLLGNREDSSAEVMMANNAQSVHKSSGLQPVLNQDAANAVWGDFQEHASAAHVSTDTVLTSSLRLHYSNLILTITDQYSCDIIGFAGAGHATLTPVGKEDSTVKVRTYYPPLTRLDGDLGSLMDQIKYGAYLLQWKNIEFIIYVAQAYDNPEYPSLHTYILTKPVEGETTTSVSSATDALMIAASEWTIELHKEIWTFDQGFWDKSESLWESVQKASWKDVILDEKMKSGLISDIDGFFDGKETYKEYAVPWKVRKRPGGCLY
jgi:transitional endoplasmic reticulum ATPase